YRPIPEALSHGAAGEPTPNGNRDGLTPTTTPTNQGATTPPLGSGTAQVSSRFDGTPAASVYFDRGGRKRGRGPPVGRGTDGLSVTLSRGVPGLAGGPPGAPPPPARPRPGKAKEPSPGRPAPPVSLAERDTPFAE